MNFLLASTVLALATASFGHTGTSSGLRKGRNLQSSDIFPPYNQQCRDDAGPPFLDDEEEFGDKKYHDGKPAFAVGDCPDPLVEACKTKPKKEAFLEGPIDCDGKGWFCRILEEPGWPTVALTTDLNFGYCNTTDGFDDEGFDKAGHCHGSDSDDTFYWWVRDHWFRGYNGRLRCCCGWDDVTDGAIVNSCDYRRLVTQEENLEDCRDANEEGVTPYRDGCSAEFAPTLGEPIPEDDAKCWEVQKFGEPDDGEGEDENEDNDNSGSGSEDEDEDEDNEDSNEDQSEENEDSNEENEDNEESNEDQSEDNEDSNEENEDNEDSNENQSEDNEDSNEENEDNEESNEDQSEDNEDSNEENEDNEDSNEDQSEDNEDSNEENEDNEDSNENQSEDNEDSNEENEDNEDSNEDQSEDNEDSNEENEDNEDSNEDQSEDNEDSNEENEDNEDSNENQSEDNEDSNEEEDDDCVNDKSFRYRGDDQKSCKWIGKKEKRINKYCPKKSDGEKVTEACPVACDACSDNEDSNEDNIFDNDSGDGSEDQNESNEDGSGSDEEDDNEDSNEDQSEENEDSNEEEEEDDCVDDKSFRFRDDDKKSCKWIGKKDNRVEKYCTKKSDGEKVSDACPVACDAC